MAEAHFDTLVVLRNLKSAGFSERQAEVVTDLISDIRQADGSRSATRADLEALSLSTKADLNALSLATKADFDALKLTTKADIETAKADIIKWGTGLIGFQTVAVLGAIVALAKALH